MAAKLHFTGKPCPTIDYDDEPCPGRMEHLGVRQFEDRHNKIDVAVYRCDYCEKEVYIRTND